MVKISVSKPIKRINLPNFFSKRSGKKRCTILSFSLMTTIFTEFNNSKALFPVGSKLFFFPGSVHGSTSCSKAWRTLLCRIIYTDSAIKTT